jgi:hypothetical protein
VFAATSTVQVKVYWWFGQQRAGDHRVQLGVLPFVEGHLLAAEGPDHPGEEQHLPGGVDPLLVASSMGLRQHARGDIDPKVALPQIEASEGEPSGIVA